MDEIKTGEVIIVHLTNGQTIVGRGAPNIDSVEDGLLLDSPHELIGGQRPDGTLGFGMQPYLSMGGLLPAFERFAFEWDNIVTARECPEQIQRAFLELTSGLQIAKTLPTGGQNGQGRPTNPASLLVVP
jgi:hypothetical protein